VDGDEVGDGHAEERVLLPHQIEESETERERQTESTRASERERERESERGGEHLAVDGDEVGDGHAEGRVLLLLFFITLKPRVE